MSDSEKEFTEEEMEKLEKLEAVEILNQQVASLRTQLDEMEIRTERRIAEAITKAVADERERVRLENRFLIQFKNSCRWEAKMYEPHTFIF